MRFSANRKIETNQRIKRFIATNGQQEKEEEKKKHQQQQVCHAHKFFARKTQSASVVMHIAHTLQWTFTFDTLKKLLSFLWLFKCFDIGIAILNIPQVLLNSPENEDANSMKTRTVCSQINWIVPNIFVVYSNNCCFFVCDITFAQLDK